MIKTRLFISLLLLALLATACSTGEVAVDETVLTVGSQAFTQGELEALGTKNVDYTNKDGETTTYSGVSLVALLEAASLSGSGTLLFTAADGFEADMPLEEALACPDCIVAIDDGSLRMVLPDFSSRLQVKDVIEISVN